MFRSRYVPVAAFTAIIVAPLLVVLAGGVGLGGNTPRSGSGSYFVSMSAPHGSTSGSRVAGGSTLVPQGSVSATRLVAKPHAWNGSLAGRHLLTKSHLASGPEAEAPPAKVAPVAARKQNIQHARPALAAPAPTVTFDGVSQGQCGCFPPDTNGDVGPDDYIQIVNVSFEIFRKTDGHLLGGSNLNSFFAQDNLNSPCSSGGNNGDPVVLYDSMSDRWIISDFAWSDFNNGPFYQCIAVSQTGDPVNGGWYFYSWQTEATNLLSDYPKLAVWPNGIYMSANIFSTGAGTPFKNVKLWAFDRQQMEAGQPAVSVSVDLPLDLPTSDAIFTVLPANVRVQTGLPPSNADEWFVAVGGAKAAFWRFHPDYVNTANTSVTLAQELSNNSPGAAPGTVADDSAEGGNDNDTLTDRTMMQVQYANISGTESLWATHTVLGASPTMAAVRWYQFGVNSGTNAVSTTQSSTWEPDSTLNRYMPSLDVNKTGAMAIGYTASNETTPADAVYAGRLSTDPANTLGQGEQALVDGTGYQCCTIAGGRNLTRWGDYSAMTLDPDGCNFWYTSEYIVGKPSLVQQNNWLTRVGSFALPGCTPTALTTTASVNPITAPYGTDITLNASLTWTPSAGVTSGIAGKTINFSLNGGNVGSATTDSSGNASLNVNLGSIAVGSHPGGITASYSGAGDFATAGGSSDLTVTMADQTITFPAIPDHALTDADFSPGASVNSNLAVQYGASGNCHMVAGNVHLDAVGSCTVSATQPGDSNHNAAVEVDRTFAIKTAATITIDTPTLSRTYDGNPKSVTATTNPAGLNYTVTYNGSGTAPTGGGTYSVIASINDPTYIGSDTETLTVAKAGQTITFNPLANKTYGNADFSVSATATSGDTVSFSAGGRCTVAGGTVHILSAGSCTITADQAGDGNYNAAPSVPQTFTIATSAVTLKYAGPLTVKHGSNAALSAKMTSATSAKPISGRKVSLKLGTQTCTAKTGSTGVVRCTIKKLSVAKGKHPVTMTFAGDPAGASQDFKAGSAKKTITVS